MQTKTYQKSWLLKCLFLVVYVNFFAVQLHFRYASGVTVEVQSGVSFSHQGNKPQAFEKSSSSKDAKSTVKLNKRFYPTPSLEATALQFRIQSRVVSLTRVTGSPTPSLCHAARLCSLLRGPPSLV